MQVHQPFDAIAVAQRLLNLESRPAWPRGKLQRPGLALVVYYRVYVDVADIAQTGELVCERFEHELGEFRFETVKQYRALLSGGAAKIANAQFFELEIFTPASVKTMGSKPSANGHLNAIDFLLQNKRWLQFRGSFPTLQHVNKIRRRLRDIGKRLVGIAGRLRYKRAILLFYVLDGIVVAFELAELRHVDPMLVQNLHPEGAIHFPIGG